MASNDEICEPNPSNDGGLTPDAPLLARYGGLLAVASAEKAPAADATTPAVKKFKSGRLKLKGLKAVFQQISDHDAAAAGEDPYEPAGQYLVHVEADTLNFSRASFIVPRGGLPFMHLSLMNCTICC
ncbi:hypothetical protein SASPL_147250 [Salvia splendens]|uniref:Uncharacterized protein n=1 Tax=Salvia splendens TaxID=180675 RepID=A0A8X8WE98_SALSN|nr:hypothetical protein SASPL_147250 [Salvia splendens]